MTSPRSRCVRSLVRRVGFAMLVPAMLLAAPAVAGAGAVRGSMTTTGYFFDGGGGRVPGPGEGGDQVSWILQRLRLDAFPGAVGGPFSFHLSLTARNQADAQRLDQTRTRVYHGYLRYRPSRALDVRVGRQYAYAGVASGVTDGASVRFRFRKLAEATVVGGTLGMESREDLRFDDPKDSRRWGAMVRVTPPRFGDVRVSGGASFERTWRNDLEDEMLLGLHGRVDLKNRIRGRFELRRDLLFAKTIGVRAGLEYLGRVRRERFWAEYNRREPFLRANSFFSSFGSRARDEARGGFTEPVWREFAVSADATLIAFDEHDQSRSFRLALSHGAHSIGWRIYRGFGGDQDGLVGSTRFTLWTPLTVYGSFGLVNYRYGEGTFERDDGAASATVGTEYRPNPSWTLRAQVEALDHPAASGDVRALGEITYRFGWR